MTNLLIIFFIFLFTYFIFKKIIVKTNRNQKLINFKNNFISKESQIEKIFTRDNEKKYQDPSINITIGIYEKEEDIIKKSNIHRSRLAKFKKSKLNGEIIYVDSDNNIYKLVKGEKKYI